MKEALLWIGLQTTLFARGWQNTENYLLIPQAKFFCRKADMLETYFGSTLSAAELLCSAREECTYVHVKGADPPLPSYTWNCKGDGFLQRLPSASDSALAVRHMNLPHDGFGLTANHNRMCGSLLESLSGPFTWIDTIARCATDRRCVSLLLDLTTPSMQPSVYFCAQEGTDSKTQNGFC